MQGCSRAGPRGTKRWAKKGMDSNAPEAVATGLGVCSYKCGQATDSVGVVKLPDIVRGAKCPEICRVRNRNIAQGCVAKNRGTSVLNNCGRVTSPELDGCSGWTSRLSAERPRSDQRSYMRGIGKGRISHPKTLSRRIPGRRGERIRSRCGRVIPTFVRANWARLDFAQGAPEVRTQTRENSNLGRPHKCCPTKTPLRRRLQRARA